MLGNLFATSKDVLSNNKEEIFCNFQKNNKPSGLDFIRKSTTPMFFDVVKPMVLESNETDNITVKKIASCILDSYSEDIGSDKIATVRYDAVVSRDNVDEEISELWHFVYNGWNWKLAGIQQP